MNFPRTNAGAKRAVGGRRTNDFAVGTRKVDVDCANCTTGRDLRCFGRRASVFGRGTFGGLEQGVEILENGEKEVPPSEKKEDHEHIPGLAKFTAERRKDVIKVNLPVKSKKIDPSKTHFTVQNIIFSQKAIRELKGEGACEIKPPIVGRGENEIAIEIHCDAGKILTKTGSRAQIGICVFLRKQITERTKNVSCVNESMYLGLVTKALSSQRLVLRGKYKQCFTVATWPGCRNAC